MDGRGLPGKQVQTHESIIRPPLVGKDSFPGLGLSTGSLAGSSLNLPHHRPTRPSRGPSRPNLVRHRNPEQPEKPIGQGCLATSLAGEEGIFVAGLIKIIFWPWLGTLYVPGSHTHLCPVFRML